jgi:hypothetical protein
LDTEAVVFTPVLGLAILRILTLLLIPVLPLAAVREATKALGPAHARFNPLIEVAAIAIGVLWAPFLVVASNIDSILGLRDIFRPGGPWDLDFIQFLTLRAVPLLLSPFALFERVMTWQAGPDLVRGTILLAMATAAVVLGPYVLSRDRVGMLHAIRNLLLVLWAAYATIYTVALLLWLANVLNFWCFLVLFALTLLVHD